MSGPRLGCYTFSARQGRFLPLRLTRVPRGFNSLSANRRLALRTVAMQAVVAIVVALCFLLQGPREALAAGVGGGAVALGSLFLAWRAMLGPAWSAGLALSRIVSGLLLKWFVVFGVLYLALARLDLPPPPLLAGLVVTLMASLLTQFKMIGGK